MTEEQPRERLDTFERTGSLVQLSESVNSLNLFSAVQLPSFGASTVSLRTEERTLAAKGIGLATEFLAPSSSPEERASHVARNEMVAEVVADTFAMLPGVKWYGAGAFRSIFLASEDKGVTGAGLDFLQGAALNKVSRLALPGSRMTKLFEGIENKIVRETATHLTVGAGFGLASTGFRPESWMDSKGGFSLGTGFSNIGTASLLGAFINVPAGAIGSRVGKMTLSGSMARSVGLDDAYVLSHVTSGTVGGVIFGGTDALLHNRNVWDGMYTGGTIGMFTGIATGHVTRPRVSEVRPGTMPAEVAPEPRTLGSAESTVEMLNTRRADLELVAATEQPLIDKVTRGKALENGVDPEVYQRLQLDMKSREIPLQDRVTALGEPEMISYSSREQKPGADVATTANYKTFGEWARDWLVMTHTPSRKYTFGPNEVIVSEVYGQQLDDVLRLRMITDQDPRTLTGAKLAEYQAAEMALKEHPMRDRAHPVDLIPFLEEVPDRTLVKRLVLSDRASADDPWHSKTYKPNFVSAASAAPDGTMTYYAQNRNFFSRETAYHEWSHILETKVALESASNAKAFELETAWAPSEYARRDAGEMFAEMGAAMLHPEADQFLMAAHSAPIRTSIYMGAMIKALQAVPTQHQSVFAKQYADRIAYVEEHILPVAQDNLMTAFQTGNKHEQLQAAVIMGNVGNRDHFLALKAVALKQRDSGVGQAAFESALGIAQRGRRGMAKYELADPESTRDQQTTFLAEMSEFGSSSRYRSMDPLRMLGKTNTRARLFHELFTTGNRNNYGPAEQARALEIVTEIQDVRGKQLAFKEALRFAGSNNETKVNMALSAMTRNPSLYPDGLRVLADAALPRTRPHLEKFATSADPNISEPAKAGLAKLERTEQFESALASLASADPNERQMGIFELGQLRDNRAISPLLETYVKSQDPAEQRLAAEMLEINYTATLWKWQAKEMVHRQGGIYGTRLRALMMGHPTYDG